jgi:RimJ/RimL family protein N-acetyltransferase
MAFRLETERLVLRPLSTDDLERLIEMYQDEQFNKLIHNSDPPGLLELAHYVEWHNECQETLGYAMWAVQEKSGGRLVGDCGFFPLEWQGPEIELAYHLHPDAWGNGYATEAAGASLRHGLTSIDKPIVAVVHPDNLPSRRVLEKIGMTVSREGIVYGTRMVVYGTADRTGL